MWDVHYMLLTPPNWQYCNLIGWPRSWPSCHRNLAHVTRLFLRLRVHYSLAPEINCNLHCVVAYERWWWCDEISCPPLIKGNPPFQWGCSLSSLDWTLSIQTCKQHATAHHCQVSLDWSFLLLQASNEAIEGPHVVCVWDCELRDWERWGVRKEEVEGQRQMMGRRWLGGRSRIHICIHLHCTVTLKVHWW